MPDAWIAGLIGGMMIGSAAALFLLINGRVMGASGILGGLIDGTGRGNRLERLAFAASLIAVPAVLALTDGGAQTYATSSLWALITAGLLVGLGTRIGNGCTSGHGVCGISRLSMRGIIATVFYLLAGGLSISVFRHVLGVI